MVAIQLADNGIRLISHLMDWDVRDKVIRISRTNGIRDFHTDCQHLPGVIPRLPPLVALGTRNTTKI